LDRGMHTVYIESVAAALRPIFIFAAGTAAIACVLACFLPQHPLQRAS
jgi:hypothetical protein